MKDIFYLFFKIGLLLVLGFVEFFIFAFSAMGSDGCGVSRNVTDNLFCSYFGIVWFLLGLYFTVTFMLTSFFLFSKSEIYRKRIWFRLFCTPLSIIIGFLYFPVVIIIINILDFLF